MPDLPPSRSAVAPLYLAGFTTAFGAHGIAAGLGAESGDIGLNILAFGFILALYDVAEVILKPIFGALSDRVGVKPVILGGLVAFALASAIGIVWSTPLWLAVARFGQGVAASAFSPASSSAVARLAPTGTAGRYFGRYGSWKGLGYAFGPLLGAGLILLDGFRGLFIALAVLGVLAAVLVAVLVPAIPVLPRPRYTLKDLVAQTVEPGFLIPTLVLAASTGALGVAVGFLPLLGSALGLGTVGSMAAVTVLAIASTVTQPFAGSLRDAGRLRTRGGTTAGLLAVTVGIVLLAVAPSPVTLYLAALLLGIGIGTATPLAFAHLADSTPPERMGRTMGNAELGREVGDAGGPLLVGAIASVASLPLGLGVLAAVTAGIGATGAATLRDPRA